jgi:2-alkyl-3-oxoalkanoate reductase
MTRKAALVGAGYIGKFHVLGLRRLPGVEIVGVTDLDHDRAVRFGKELSIPAYPSLAAMREAGAQVVHVLTPPAAHAAIALAAMALGCDVLIEKPLATSAEDCERIALAASQSGRTVCVGHSLLFDPFVRRALDLVASGAIGEVVAFDYCRSLDQHAYATAAFSAEHQRGGYPFRDIGIHALYLAEAFLGPIADLHASPAASGRGDCTLWVDEWRVLAQCQRGHAHIQLSWKVKPQQHLFTVQGTRGVIRVDLFGLAVTVKRQRPLPEHATRIINAAAEGSGIVTQAFANVARIASGRVWQFHGVQALIADFYQRLERGQEAAVTADDARRAVVWTEHVARIADRARDEWAASLTSPRGAAPVLVTGGGGFIGRPLVKRLLDQGTRVRLLLRRAPAPEVIAHPLAEIMIGDLADPQAVDRAVAGVDTVYHLGATMRGSAAEFQRGTIAGTRNVVDACLRHDVRRLVYMSSLAVIDTDAGRNGEPITETSPLERVATERGSYTQTKLDAEALVLRAVREQALRTIILRPGEVVSEEKPLLTPGVAQRLGGTLLVLGAGLVRLPLVHVDDVVEAVLLAGSAEVESGTIVHVVEDTGVTQNDIIASYQAASDRPPRVVRLPLPFVLFAARVAEVIFTRLLGSAPIGPRRIRAATASRRFDCRVAEQALGWRPRTGMAHLMGRTVAARPAVVSG